MKKDLEYMKRLRDAINSNDEFAGKTFDRDKVVQYNRLIELAEEIVATANTDPFINIATDYKESIPNTQRNATVFLNVLVPVNINRREITKAFKEMLDICDNFVVTVLDDAKGGYVVRYGFSVRDVWTDGRGGS